MPEQWMFATPVTKPSATCCHLSRVTLDFDAQSVLIEWCADTGEMSNAYYTTPPSGASPSGAKLLAQILTGDFSTTSLVRWLLTTLQADKCLPDGTIDGKPDTVDEVLPGPSPAIAVTP